MEVGLARIAVVYVRQSTMTQVTGNLESQRRQYDLAGTEKATGFKSMTVIDDDLGRSGFPPMAEGPAQALKAWSRLNAYERSAISDSGTNRPSTSR
jgi:hypothetical protein